MGRECELDHRIVVALLSFGALMLTLSAARRAENRRYAAQAYAQDIQDPAPDRVRGGSCDASTAKARGRESS